MDIGEILDAIGGRLAPEPVPDDGPWILLALAGAALVVVVPPLYHCFGMVIGNLAAGGAGKTPLTIAVVQKLREAGWNVTETGNLTLPDTTVTTVFFSDAAGEQQCAEELADLDQTLALFDALLDRGDRIVVEDPTYPLIFRDLQHHEVEVLNKRRGEVDAAALTAGQLPHWGI